MRLIIYFLAFALIPIVGFAQFPSGKLVTKNKYFELPLVNIEDEILVKANLRGEEFTFMLDTGAPLFISTELQKKFNFPVLFRADLKDASGKAGETIVVSIDSITIGPFSFKDVWAIVIDFGNDAHQCHKFVGNVGSNLLSFLTLQFDLQEGKVNITDNIKLLKHKPAVPYSQADLSGQSNFVFPITIAKNIIDTVLFDSGDGALYEISGRALNRLIEMDSSHILRRGFGATSMGSLGMPDQTNQYLVQTNVRINNSDIQNVIANNTSASQSRIGRFLFHYGVVTLDYVKRRYAFEKYKTPVLPLRDEFGFVPILDGHKLMAGNVWENTEAAKKGMVSGCEILAINEVRFSDLSLCDIMPTLKKMRHNEERIKLIFLDKSGAEKMIELTKMSFDQP